MCYVSVLPLFPSTASFVPRLVASIDEASNWEAREHRAAVNGWHVFIPSFSLTSLKHQNIFLFLVRHALLLRICDEVLRLQCQVPSLTLTASDLSVDAQGSTAAIAKYCRANIVWTRRPLRVSACIEAKWYFRKLIYT